jgi:hypothetical protein
MVQIGVVFGKRYAQPRYDHAEIFAPSGSSR